MSAVATSRRRATRQRSAAPAARRAGHQRPVSRRAAVNVDCCLLCGARSEGSYWSDLRHVRSNHPGYARGLLLRLASPLLFVVAVLGLGTVHAPQWTFIGALTACAVLFIAGIAITRRERGAAAGSGGSTGLVRLLREGGWRFLLIPIAIIALMLLGRR